MRASGPSIANGAPVRIKSVLAAMRDMRARQTLHDITGATHAAGWSGADAAVATHALAGTDPADLRGVTALLTGKGDPGADVGAVEMGEE